MASIYQQQVAEIDRRHQVRVRALSFIGAATLAVIAFWSAGLPPTEWYARLHKWLSHESSAMMKPTPPLIPAAVAPVTAPAPASAKPLPGTDSSISPVSLPLYLIATSPGRNVHEGTARIGTSSENPQTYVAGAILANGARIAEIYNDHVLLEHNHKRAKLYLKLLGKTDKRGLTDLLTVGGAEPPKPAAPMPREILTDYIRPAPQFEGEVLRGYQVYSGQKASLFYQLGLQSGDVITSINDAPLVDTATAYEALSQITNGTSIVVSVQRRGKLERITLDGSLVLADQQQAKIQAMSGRE
jgi:type II secretion system protein C